MMIHSSNRLGKGMFKTWRCYEHERTLLQKWSHKNKFLFQAHVNKFWIVKYISIYRWFAKKILRIDVYVIYKLLVIAEKNAPFEEKVIVTNPMRMPAFEHTLSKTVWGMNHCFVPGLKSASHCLTDRRIGGPGGKSDEKSGQWENLLRGEIIIGGYQRCPTIGGNFRLPLWDYRENLVRRSGRRSGSGIKTISVK